MTTQILKIEQCLFGYDDGHRLLASSIPLASQTANLTQMSDLVPGTRFGAAEGYWTGMPVPKLGRYMLMRTWPAPEMPRPGCVWSHALLMDPAAFDELSDLDFLRALVHRPTSARTWSQFEVPIELDLHRIPNGEGLQESDEARAALILEALYGGVTNVLGSNETVSFDRSIFAVWSQQWPRLRRNFRFQTALSQRTALVTADRLDLSFTLDEFASTSSELPVAAPWIQEAVADLESRDEHGLRSFLRRYASDVKRQRASFQPLCEIRSLDSGHHDRAGHEVLRLLLEAFPEPNDALKLKQDIVDGALVPSAQLEVLWFIISGPDNSVMPEPSEKGVSRLSLLWPSHQVELLHLAERTADRDDNLSRAIFSTVAKTIPAADFWEATATYPRIRGRMVEARPELVLSGDVLALDNGQLAMLVATLPISDPAAEALISKLLARDDSQLADTAFERFPESTARQVIQAANGGTFPISRAWMRSLVRRPAVLLQPVVMGEVTRTSLLYEIAEDLGWLTNDVALAGADPWLAALVDIQQDLSEDRRNTLRSFLLALAFSAPGESARKIIEWFFEPVHAEALHSNLPWKAREILEPFLPDLGWSRNLDFGLRMRLSVTWAYVSNEYDTAGFKLLARDRRSRDLLAGAAEAVKGGKKYAKSLKR